MTDRQLAESLLGRRLHWYEEVHYVDDCPWNNDPGNLEIRFRVISAPCQPKDKPETKARGRVCVICGGWAAKLGKRYRKTCSAKCHALLMARINRRPEAPFSFYNQNAPASRAKQRKEYVPEDPQKTAVMRDGQIEES